MATVGALGAAVNALRAQVASMAADIKELKDWKEPVTPFLQRMGQQLDKQDTAIADIQTFVGLTRK